MNPTELKEAVAIELEAMQAVVDELVELERDLSGRAPTVRENAAAAAFMAQFYNGVENILTRISRYSGVALPAGETWHVNLFQRFCSPSHPDLPALFDASLAADMAPYRRFRHVAFHGYAFQIDWDRLAGGVAGIQDVFSRFKDSVSEYLGQIVT